MKKLNEYNLHLALTIIWPQIIFIFKQIPLIIISSWSTLQLNIYSNKFKLIYF
jgi:hypothetical protein